MTFPVRVPQNLEGFEQSRPQCPGFPGGIFDDSLEQLYRTSDRFFLRIATLTGRTLECTHMDAHVWIPRFEDYPVPTPLPGRLREAVITAPYEPEKPGGAIEATAHFQARLRIAAKDGPDFAGRFAVVRWNHRPNWQGMKIVNVKTGKIYDTPFIAVSAAGHVDPSRIVSYRLDSRLFVVTGATQDEGSDHMYPGGFDQIPWGKSCYVWRRNRLCFISWTAFRP